MLWNVAIPAGGAGGQVTILTAADWRSHHPLRLCASAFEAGLINRRDAELFWPGRTAVEAIDRALREQPPVRASRNGKRGIASSRLFTVVAKRALTPEFSWLQVEAPEIAAHWKPGQFVILRPTPESERISLTVVQGDGERGTIVLVVQALVKVNIQRVVRSGRQWPCLRILRHEAEEAKWWDDHRRMAEQELIKAIRDGTAQRGAAQRLAKQSRASKNITIRMPVDDIERARRLADRKGLGYQTYMKMLLHEALNREESSANTSPRHRKTG